jgi:hypothetical protein
MIPAAGSIQRPPAERLDTVPTEINDGATTAAQRATQAYAQRLFNAYQRENRRILAKVWLVERYRELKYNSDTGKLWRRMASTLMAAGVTNVEGFVHYQVRYGKTKRPSQLTMYDAIDKYVASLAAVCEGQVLEWQATANAFNTHAKTLAAAMPTATKMQVQKIVLSNLLYGFSSLFCYCVAVRNGHDDLAAGFHDAALQQLLTDRDGYAKNWADYLPAQLLEEAAKMIDTFEH